MTARRSTAIPAARSRARFAAALLVLVCGVPACAVAPVRSSDPALVRRVTDLARALVGTPYRYGGDTPRGFDCSGFIRYVYRKAANLTLPHSSRRLFAAGRAVPRGQEEPGDLIFYSTRGGGPTHVGVYLGQGRFVHAPGESDAVKIVDGTEPYWRARYLGARRVFP